jgi:hypothetical protein
MKIRVTDGGDGSTFIKITLDSNKVVYLNPDIPYEGYYEATIGPGGDILDQQEVHE